MDPADCSQVENAHVAMLDRWRVDLRDSIPGQPSRKTNKIMNNYFGVGCDAQIALQFHEH